MDALLDTDWAAHWRDLVDRRQALLGTFVGSAWDARAASFQARTQGQPEPFLDLVRPHLGPGRTLLDVGAGYGRHSIPLAGDAEWVTVVEPSAGMRALIPDLPSMTVVGSSWEDAEVEPSDVVICCHVMYWVAEVLPFIEKLEAAARSDVFLLLRDGLHPAPAEHLVRPAPPREPKLSDAYCLLRQMGVHPEVRTWRDPRRRVYPAPEDALVEARAHLGPAWDEARNPSQMRAGLKPGPDGGVVYEGPDGIVGCLHWRAGERG
jgi:SAM-dependent methyltransferase